MTKEIAERESGCPWELETRFGKEWDKPRKII